SARDAFWTWVRKIDTFRCESAFGSWLYQIVANAAYQKLRGQRSRGRDLSLDEVLPSFDAWGGHVSPMADWSARVDDPAVQTELRAALTSAINELPPASRTVLVLRDVEGQSTLAIAEALGLSVSVVKSRVHRAGRRIACGFCAGSTRRAPYWRLERSRSARSRGWWDFGRRVTSRRRFGGSPG